MLPAALSPEPGVHHGPAFPGPGTRLRLQQEPRVLELSSLFQSFINKTEEGEGRVAITVPPRHENRDEDKLRPFRRD